MFVFLRISFNACKFCNYAIENISIPNVTISLINNYISLQVDRQCHIYMCYMLFSFVCTGKIVLTSLFSKDRNHLGICSIINYWKATPYSHSVSLYPESFWKVFDLWNIQVSVKNLNFVPSLAAYSDSWILHRASHVVLYFQGSSVCPETVT